MLDVPNELLTTRPNMPIVRSRLVDPANSGIDGIEEIDRRLKYADQQLLFEQTRPNSVQRWSKAPEPEFSPIADIRIIDVLPARRDNTCHHVFNFVKLPITFSGSDSPCGLHNVIRMPRTVRGMPFRFRHEVHRCLYRTFCGDCCWEPHPYALVCAIGVAPQRPSRQVPVKVSSG